MRRALFFALLLAVATAVSLYAEPSKKQQQPFSALCVNPETRDKIQDIMNDSIDRALSAHIVNVYEVWMRDSAGQPHRARVGALQGVNAYLQARKDIADWAPNPC